MTSKIISSMQKSSVPDKYIRTEICKKDERTLKFKSIGGQEQRRDLTLLSPPYDISSLRAIGDNSSILNQCIDAYAHNIVGFGIDIRYKVDDSTITEAMKSEWNKLSVLLQELNFERPPKEVLEEVIHHVEECGNGYIEVSRNGTGEVVGIDAIKPEFLLVTKLNRVEMQDGTQRKFRYFNYRDTTDDSGIKETSIWYKSFGDPTPLNYDGSISKEGEGTATEVIHLKIGDFGDPYGVPRYIGALIKILGSRKADELNYRYFTQGRHMPLAILLENAQLTDESEATLQSYANEIGGEGSQHKFLLLEAEKVSSKNDMLSEEKDKPTIKLEKLADILQKDALFLEYDQKTTDAVLSAFRLPPVYVGMSTDYNRATVETAKELTEEQVFQPRREGYEWRINDMLKEYDFQYVELYLKSPNLSNTEDIKNILDAATQAGGVAPNDLRDIVGKTLNKPLEPFEGEQYNYPTNTTRSSTSLEMDLEKAYGDNSLSELAGSVRRLLRRSVKYE